MLNAIHQMIHHAVYQAILLAICLLFLDTSTVFAQEKTGTYTMFVGGNVVGAESYTLIPEPDGGLRAEAELSVGGSNRKTTTVISKNRWVSFSAQAGTTPLISAAFDGTEVKLQVAGQQERRLTTKASVILENGLWHHFIFLFNHYDAQKGGSQNIAAFLPSQATDFDLRVERIGTQSYEIDGKQIATERYRFVSSSGLILDLWADSSHTPLVILIEAQGVKVVRKGEEPLAEAISKAGSKAGSKPTLSDDWSSEDVQFQNGEVTLAGTLTIPRKGDGRHPAALIISGSGSQDRDGNLGLFGFYRLIAEHLSTNGFAVLRHDDRGAGKSNLPKTPTTYRDLINDSRAAVEYLRNRKEIDPDRIILIGHSEGGTTASIMATEDSRIAAIVLLAGAMLSNLDQVVLEQTVYQQALGRPTNPLEREKYPEIVRRLIALIDDAKANKADSSMTDLNEYFRQHLALNMAETYKRVRCPVLILQGERDAQVLARHAVAAALALTEAGNKRVLVRIFPNLSHGFAPSPLDKSIPAEKKNEISPEVLDTIQRWAAEAVKK